MTRPGAGSRRDRLPAFSLEEYRELLEDLLAAGYAPRLVQDLAEREEGLGLFLRHDVDIHVPGIERMAGIEAQLGVRATYYIPMGLPFNPFYPANRVILNELAAMGHSIGLHYDLVDYPVDDAAARGRLDREAEMLGEIAGSSVRTICMHAPSLRGEDRFRDVEGYVNPHDPRHAEGLLYISDSCRAWRDEELLRCFGAEPPARVVLNTHPELWLGRAEESRDEFLHGTLLANAIEQERAYLIDELGAAWAVHPGPAAEEARTGARRA